MCLKSCYNSRIVMLIFSFILSNGETSFGLTIRFHAFSRKCHELDLKLINVVYFISTGVKLCLYYFTLFYRFINRVPACEFATTEELI